MNGSRRMPTGYACVCARAPVRVKQRAVLPEGNKKQDIPIKMQPLGSKLLIAN